MRVTPILLAALAALSGSAHADHSYDSYEAFYTPMSKFYRRRPGLKLADHFIAGNSTSR
ncbi:hypothetical protein QFZ97_001626 [Paraburkholderia youngii]